MKVTTFTRETLQHRRAVKKLLSEGYEEVGEDGGSLWEIYRGWRMGWRITDAKVPPGGMSVYVKIERDAVA